MRFSKHLTSFIISVASIAAMATNANAAATISWNVYKYAGAPASETKMTQAGSFIATTDCPDFDLESSLLDEENYVEGELVTTSDYIKKSIGDMDDGGLVLQCEIGDTVDYHIELMITNGTSSTQRASGKIYK